MIETLGKTQQTLLHSLQAHKAGMTMDQLAETLNITRTAVRQHLTALEVSGFIQKGQMLSSGGRPSQFYQLTKKGFDLFPKQYSLFSNFLLETISLEKGQTGLSEWLGQIGSQVAQNFQNQTEDADFHGRLIKTVNIMNMLAYDAELVEDSKNDYAIEAVNCVYHDLAESHPQVCQFDISLITTLTDSQITHEKCIQKGDDICRFCIKKTNNNH